LSEFSSLRILRPIFEMFIKLIWIFNEELHVVYNSEFARQFVSFVFALFIFAQYSLCWWQNEGAASRDWRHANVSLLGVGVRDRVRANRTRVTGVCTLVGSNAARIDSLHGHFCCTSNLHLPHNITFTFTSAVTYKQLFSGLRNSFWKFLFDATFKVFTVTSIKIQVFHFVKPCLLVIFIYVSATGLYLFNSRHGVICQYIQIFYLTHVFTDKYQFTNRSVLCAWNRFFLITKHMHNYSNLFRYKTLHVSGIFSAHLWNILTLLGSGHQTCMKLSSAECTVENSWWWAQKMPETCRVF